MARMNISIPDDLKEKMDKASDLNWSEIAREAFTTQLMIYQLKGTDMNQAGIERLRASKVINVEREHAEGVALGKSWALEQGQYDEVERVAALYEDGNVEALTLGFAVAGGTYAEAGYEALAEIFDTKDPSEAMVEGFIEGAAEVFEQV